MMGWWKTAKPGDPVVYIDDSGEFTGITVVDPLCFGDAVKIEEIAARSMATCGVGLYFGHRNALGGKIWYSAHRFRPVQTKSTDTGMAILKRVIERPEQRIEEDA
jgi:hypothetical protein